MKLQKFIFAFVAICAFTLTSCSETTVEEDAIYDEQSPYKLDIKTIHR